MKLKLAAVSLFICAAILAPGCSALLPVEEEVLPPPLIEPTKVRYVTEKPVRGTIENIISGYGSVYAENQTDVYLRDTGGTLAEFHVSPGLWVNEGDILLEFENRGLKDSLEESEMRHAITVLQHNKVRQQYYAGEADIIALKTAELNLYLSEKGLNKLRDALESTQIFAPVSGYINYIAEINIYDFVNKDTKLFTIADTNSLLVKYMGTRQEEIPLGATMVGSFRSNPAELYEFTVVSSPFATKDKTPVLAIPADEELQIIKPEGEGEEGGGIRVNLGDTVDLKFVLEKSEDALIVRRSALKQQNNRTFVYVLRDGYKQERDVKAGIITSTQVEIIEGLTEEDDVIV